jgi:hypothetical protein
MSDLPEARAVLFDAETGNVIAEFEGTAAFTRAALNDMLHYFAGDPPMFFAKSQEPTVN